MVYPHRWTAAELKKVIAMLQNPEFDSKDIDPDLHQRMAKAVDDGCIKCFNLREGAADGDQDLNLWIREVEDVCREIMEDPLFKGNQNFHFEMGSVRGCLAVRQMLKCHFRLAN